MADVLPIKGHRAFEREVRASAARTLMQARERKPSEVLVIGIDKDGELFVGGYPPNPGGALWLMELAKRQLCRGDGNG